VHGKGLRDYSLLSIAIFGLLRSSGTTASLLQFHFLRGASIQRRLYGILTLTMRALFSSSAEYWGEYRL